MIEKMFAYIGFHGPFILFICTFFLLLQKKTLLTTYVLGYIFNIITNYVLKQEIREKRPSNRFHSFHLDGRETYIELPHLGAHEYGMPSGHAQCVGYSVVFSWFALHQPYITLLYTIAGLNTIYQRVKYKAHTWKQVGVGSILGALIGYLVFQQF